MRSFDINYHCYTECQWVCTVLISFSKICFLVSASSQWGFFFAFFVSFSFKYILEEKMQQNAYYPNQVLFFLTMLLICGGNIDVLLSCSPRKSCFLWIFKNNVIVFWKDQYYDPPFQTTMVLSGISINNCAVVTTT